MTYLLDTDHLSIIQRKTGVAYETISGRMSQYSVSEFAISIITIQEQMLGCHAYINRARHLSEMVTGYRMMNRLVRTFQTSIILPFDELAARQLEQLQTKGIRLGKMDARIAAIALANQRILLTRNRQDFEKVPGLTLEDWTI